MLLRNEELRVEERVEYRARCPGCQYVYYSSQEYKARDQAIDCCNGICTDCGEKRGTRYRNATTCAVCRSRVDHEKAKENYDKATKVHARDYGGMVYDPHRDIYAESVEDALDYYDSKEEAPEFFYGTDTTEFHLDAESIVEDVLQEHYEDAGDNITPKEMKELQDFLTKWSEKTGIRTYHEDRSVIVLYDRDKSFKERDDDKDD